MNRSNPDTSCLANFRLLLRSRRRRRFIMQREWEKIFPLTPYFLKSRMMMVKMMLSKMHVTTGK